MIDIQTNDSIYKSRNKLPYLWQTNFWQKFYIIYCSFHFHKIHDRNKGLRTYSESQFQWISVHRGKNGIVKQLSLEWWGLGEHLSDFSAVGSCASSSYLKDLVWPAFSSPVLCKKESTVFQSSTTSWGCSVQGNEPVGDMLHLTWYHNWYHIEEKKRQVFSSKGPGTTVCEIRSLSQMYN